MSKTEKNYEKRLIKKLIIKAKKRARRRENTIFLNAGIMGIFGWHICVPIVMGTILGIWLDKVFDKNIFVISLMLLGLFVGGYNAYRWTKRNMALKTSSKEDEIILESEKTNEVGE